MGSSIAAGFVINVDPTQEGFMRLTRFSAVLFTVAIPTLVACGGDDGTSIKIPDAKVFQDAPIDVSTACSAPAMIPGGGSIGTMAMPAARQSGDWIEADTDGNIAFELAFRPSSSDMQNVLVFVVPKPEQGPFTAMAYPLDPDPMSTDPDNAFAYMQANIDVNAGTVGRVLFASSGSITFSAIGQNANDLITGTLSAVNFREIDLNTAADVPGGCTSMLGADVEFFLKQSSTVAREIPGGNGRPPRIRLEVVGGLETSAN